MTARKAPYQCANPVCGAEIPPDEPLSLELAQVRLGGGSTYRDRWHLCGVTCLRQYLSLCMVKARADAHPEATEVEP